MEVILSAAFGTLSEAQTNPNDKVTSYAKDAMSPRPWPNIAMMVPFIGKKLSKALTISRWGFNWGPIIEIAGKILKQRRESEGEARQVSGVYFPVTGFLFLDDCPSWPRISQNYMIRFARQ